MNLVGQKLGHLTIIEFIGIIPYKGRIWKVRCDCGDESLRSSSRLNLNQRRNKEDGSIPMCKKCAMRKFLGARRKGTIRQKSVYLQTMRAIVNPSAIEMDPFLDCTWGAYEAFRSGLMEELEWEICPRRDWISEEELRKL
jgi:hypothetical protein